MHLSVDGVNGVGTYTCAGVDKLTGQAKPTLERYSTVRAPHPHKPGQRILYTSAAITDCVPHRGGGALRRLHEFEEPQLLPGHGALLQAPYGLGTRDDQRFVRRQRNQCTLW